MLSTKIGRVEFANAPGMSAILTPLIDHAMVQEYENTTPSRHHVPLAMTQMTTSSLAASISLWDSTQTGGPLSHDSHVNELSLWPDLPEGYATSHLQHQIHHPHRDRRIESLHAYPSFKLPRRHTARKQAGHSASIHMRTS